MSIIKRALKAAWDSLQQPHDPLNPAPDVQAELEKAGYTFRFNVYAGYRTVIKRFDVTNPEGQRVGQFGADKEATARYVEDYKHAVAACRKQPPAPTNN